MSVRASSSGKPTVVLVHGAFAESSSWSGVVSRLLADDYPVLAAAVPLRGVKADSAYLASVLEAIEGEIVLVAHSYGGMLASNAAVGNENVKALVFVGGFAPEAGETAVELSSRFEGSTLGETLAAFPLPDGNTDLYIRQDRYHGQFAADSSPEAAAVLGATQRPITEAALNEAAGEPAWKTVPSWFLFGSDDKNIPVAAHRFMAERAGSRRTVELEGGSHTVGIPEAAQVVDLIREAAAATRPQQFANR
jgi:pimeloyl-ACP methyl ester carboxylesterase